jgi:integrase
LTPDTLVIDIQFQGIGRVNRRSGTLDPKVVRDMKRAAKAVYKAGRLDVLRALRDRHITWLEFYDAYQRNTLDALPIGGTVAKLEPAMRAWIEASTPRYSDKHVVSLGTSLGYLAGAKKDARVADLPAILDKLRSTLGLRHARSFNLARSAAQAFVRATLKRNHPIYLACGAVELVKVTKQAPRHPITLTRMRELFPCPASDALDAIAWSIATCGFRPKEYWGAWEVRSDRVHIDGTKTGGSVRDVPLVRRPDRPPLSRDRFEKVFRTRFHRVITPYQLRRTYAQWMEEAGFLGRDAPSTWATARRT